MVVTYSKHLPNMGEIVRRRLPILHRSEKMKGVFKEPALTAYRRARNIADISVHTKHMVLQLNNAIQPGIFPGIAKVTDVAKRDWYRMTDVCLFLMTW